METGTVENQQGNAPAQQPAQQQPAAQQPAQQQAPAQQPQQQAPKLNKFSDEGLGAAVALEGLSPTVDNILSEIQTAPQEPAQPQAEPIHHLLRYRIAPPQQNPEHAAQQHAAQKAQNDGQQQQPAQQGPAQQPAQQQPAQQEPSQQDPAQQDPAQQPQEPAYQIDGETLSKEDFIAKIKDPEFVEKLKSGEHKYGVSGDDEVLTMLEQEFAPAVDSPLFGGQKKFYDKPQNQLDPIFEENEEVAKYVKDHFGVDNASDFFQKVAPEWRNKAQAYSEMEQKVNGFNSLFEQMPAQLYQGIQNFFSGKDWKEPIASIPDFDFNVPAENQNPIDLVEHYYGDRISVEDLEAYADEDDENHAAAVKMINALIPEAQNKYNTQKSEFDGLRAQQIEKANQQNQLFEDSIKSSASHLKNLLPDAAPGYVDSLVDRARSGGFHNLFFKEDGSLKEDALLKLSMAEDGFDLYQQMAKAISNKAVTAERQEILMRGAKSPQSRGTSSPDNGVRPETQSYLNQLLGGVQQQTMFK